MGSVFDEETSEPAPEKVARLLVAKVVGLEQQTERVTQMQEGLERASFGSISMDVS